jgi:hypothetical protein
VIGASEPQAHTRHADRTEGKCQLCGAIGTRARQYGPALYSESAGHSGWRLSFGTAEDRNATEDRNEVVSAAGAHPVGWRSPSGATEDRNKIKVTAKELKRRGWRSPSGAAEDRKTGSYDALRGLAEGGGRPSERPRDATAPRPRRASGSPSGSRLSGWLRIATLSMVAWRLRRTSGGRPPGRPRIATPAPGVSAWRSGPWRSSFGAAEDRNAIVRGLVDYVQSSGGRHSERPSTATCGGGRASQPTAGVAVVLRDGRGSQRPAHRTVGRLKLVWRSPSGVAEDRNVIGTPDPLLSVRWRSSSRATKDRNDHGWHPLIGAIPWRWASDYAASFCHQGVMACTAP